MTKSSNQSTRTTDTKILQVTSKSPTDFEYSLKTTGDMRVQKILNFSSKEKLTDQHEMLCDSIIFSRIQQCYTV